MQGASSGIRGCGLSLIIGLSIGTLAALHALPALARSGTEAIAAGMSDAISISEEQSARAVRCTNRIPALKQKLASLKAVKSRNPQEIAETARQLENNRRCAEVSTHRVAIAEDELGALRQIFLERSEAPPVEIDTRIEALRGRELTRAQIDFQVSLIERQIARLDEEPEANANLIKQKHAVLEGLRGDLTVAQDGIERAAGRLSDSGSASAQAARHAARLSWSTPVTRENGTPLALGELGGFEIYMLCESTGESEVFVVDDPLEVSYTFAGLAPDTYYFSISAFD
ncbi:MAG: fibronectin type III domain-containing protein, partial [Pseudomonadales bacterium]|nr:fibronectin type III domain-containing protein [Pseudomonadales bacterium]